MVHGTIGGKKLFRTPLSTHKKGNKSHPLLKKKGNKSHPLLKKYSNIFCLNLIALPSLAEFPAVATATSVSFPAG